MFNVLAFHLFFFNDTATTEIYTLSLHDALPISRNGLSVNLSNGVPKSNHVAPGRLRATAGRVLGHFSLVDRKSTRLNSSHPSISYAVFCLKKKKKHDYINHLNPLDQDNAESSVN